MACNEMLRHSELTTYAAHLVLEQPLQRFAELQVHLLGQSADVVMALDDLTRNVQRLNAVRIDGALGKPAGIGDFLGLGIENLDEVAADNLSFLLGLGDTSQIGKELLAGIDADDVQAEHLVVVHHLLELVLAQHTVVDEDTSQTITNGAVQQYSSHRGIDTARESEDNAVVA